jgi:hypothetical protein
MAGEAIDEGALPCSGSAGDADAGLAVQATGLRAVAGETGRKDGGREGRAVLNERDGAGEGAGIAGAEAADEG